MKKIISSSVLTVLLFACSDRTNQTQDKTAQENTTEQTSNTATASSIEGALNSYLEVKNALADDNGSAAAKAANTLNKELQSYGAGQLNDAQKKVYADVEEEALEHSEHIGKNADKIDHQRSHFNKLSVVMYDLIKSNKTDRILYKQYCPMYNDKKGGLWISEKKEIQNPFYGKEMLECGEIKEEIK